MGGGVYANIKLSSSRAFYIRKCIFIDAFPGGTSKQRKASFYLPVALQSMSVFSKQICMMANEKKHLTRRMVTKINSAFHAMMVQEQDEDPCQE